MQDTHAARGEDRLPQDGVKINDIQLEQLWGSYDQNSDDKLDESEAYEVIKDFFAGEIAAASGSP